MESANSIHVMRDNPSHNFTIMGGMWGVKIKTEKRAFWNNLVAEIFRKSTSWDYFEDQNLLDSLVWPVVQQDTMVHDSYLCTQIQGGHIHPFPTKRALGPANFVWSVPGLSHSMDTVPCPRECRPKDHQEWTTC